MAKDTPHWDTPYGTKGGGSKKGLLGLLGLALFCVVGCLITMVGRSLKDVVKKDPDTVAAHTEGEIPKEDAESAETKQKNKELAKLSETRRKFKAIISDKLDKAISRLQRDRSKTKAELLRLKNSGDRSRTTVFKMKNLLQEYKEVDRFLSRLEKEKEKYEMEVFKLESAERRVRRQLELAEFLDEGERKKIEKLLARGDVLIESAEKHGFEKLSDHVEAEEEKKTGAKDDENVDAELDKVLGGD